MRYADDRGGYPGTQRLSRVPEHQAHIWQASGGPSDCSDVNDQGTTRQESDILVEAELVEKDMTPLVVVPERFDQCGRGLWPRVGHAARGEERRRGLDTWEEAGKHLLRGRRYGDDNLWWCGGGHGGWDLERQAFDRFLIALSRQWMSICVIG